MTKRARDQISVVIPVKGHPVLLDDAIGAVQRELAHGVIRRIVVVNDGCRYEETRASIAAWQAVLGEAMHAIEIPNAGLSGARNRGIDRALEIDPDIAGILLLDADNMLAEGASAAMRQVLETYPDKDWFYPDFDFFGQKGNYVTEREPSLLFHAHINICEAGSLIRRRVFEAGIRFDEAMRQGYEDWDFWLSASRKGFRGQPFAQPMLLYRKRPVSMLSNSHDVDGELRRFLEKKHSWLFSTRSLLALEAEQFPRYAIIEGSDDTALLCTDPERGETVAIGELERKLFAHLGDPYSHHVPAYFVFLREGVTARLAEARVLRNFLWNCERRSTRRNWYPDYELFFLDSAEGSHAIRNDAGNPERAADGVIVSLEQLRRIIVDRDANWVRDVDRVPCPHQVSSWDMALDGISQPKPYSDAGNEVFRNFLFTLLRSRYRAALSQRWSWREPGGAASRAMASEIPRKATSGGVVFPLLKQKGRRDIAFVLPIFDFGGVEKVAASMAREFAAAGDRVHLVVASDRPIHRDVWTLEAFSTVNWLPDPSTIDWTGPEFLGTAEPSWGNAHERADLCGLLSSMDVVINAHSGALHKVADRLRRQGTIMIDHEHLLERSIYGRGYGPPKLALAYEYAYDLFLTCSESLRYWLGANGIPREKLCPVVNAPGYPLAPSRIASVLKGRRSRAKANGPLRVLFMGRLDPQKGVHRLVEIYNGLALRAPSIQLSIAGQSVINEAGGGFGFPKHTRMLGAVRGPEALTELLAETDVVVLPSLYEGLPLSVLEAQRCGVVVIATDVGAMREAIEDGSNGFVMPEENCEELFITQILALDQDRALLQRVSRAAERDARSWSDAIQPLQQWLDARWEGRACEEAQAPFLSSEG
ncbi:glycosyltransferase [Paracoccus sp. MBLB3053]|uniref:Glycosyltransferase n=1 Tax=Paracoccus aurantius TaxID=3073814 RepID=A0ABU2HNQ4_9RHOB|nr:glycosyltransferase [Paracoccus sp. MBLB3053]MDS9466200.1 glycosyltransferase [Paracoccus sp. MBLB3053]